MKPNAPAWSDRHTVFRRLFIHFLLPMLALLCTAAGLSATPSGRVMAWGDNTHGQCNVPADLTNCIAVAAGPYHSLALRTNGTVVAWGDGSSGETNVPPDLGNVVAVYAGYRRSVALQADGTVVTWGAPSFGISPAAQFNVASIALSSGNEANAAVLTRDGHVLGFDGSPWPMPGDLESSNVTAFVLGSSKAVAYAAGAVHTWNLNDTSTELSSPYLPAISTLAGGGDVFYALTASGHVTAWCYYWQMPFLDYSVFGSWTSNMVALSAAGGAALGIDPNGTILRLVPRQYETHLFELALSGMANAVAVADGLHHSLAIVEVLPPAIVRQPNSQQAASGQLIVFEPQINGSGPFEFQWFHDGEPIDGATNQCLVIASVSSADAGAYTLRMSNPSGTQNSQPANLTVQERMPAVTVPERVLLAPGTDLVIAATVAGSRPIVLQWRHSGAAIPDATNAILVISNAQASDAGTYTLVADNAQGRTVSDSVRVDLSFRYDFTNVAGPLVWNFAPVLPDGVTYARRNQVWTRAFAHSTDREVRGLFQTIFRETSCTTLLRLDAESRTLTGTRRCVVTRSRPEFIDSREVISTTQLRTNITLSLPFGMNGFWRLELNVVPAGNRYTGTATATLDSGKAIPLSVTGTYDVGTHVARLRLLGRGSYRGNVLNLQASGDDMAITTMRGTLARQRVTLP